MKYKYFGLIIILTLLDSTLGIKDKNSQDAQEEAAINEMFQKIKSDYEEKMKNLPEPKPVDPDFLAYKNKIIGEIMNRGKHHHTDKVDS